jgi:hypothetical protein
VERLLAEESALGRKDSNDNTLLHIAGQKMHWPLFKVLLEKGSDLKGDVDLLRRIIPVGELIESLRKPSYSPAYLASQHDDSLASELIKVLREAGGHVLYPGSGNYSLLENALRSARIEVVKAIDPDYPISEPLSRGITLLTIADTGTYMVSFEPSSGDLIVGFGSRVRGEEGGLNYPARELGNRRKRELEKAGAQWFIPYLEKYVAGEDVVVADLEGEYLERFGEPMKIYYAKWSKEKSSSPSFVASGAVT